MPEAPTTLSGKKMLDPKEWERKARLKEYRIASRREKRNRKSDEKKQRKLNATILRRMTRNPDKYNKNAGRNMMRAIEMERRKIWANAIKMAQRLAAIHDPSGAKFNVSPVVTMEDGNVISQDAFERRQEKIREKEAREAAIARGEDPPPPASTNSAPNFQMNGGALVNGMNPARAHQLDNSQQRLPPSVRPMSKTQQRKAEMYTPRPPPPRPTIPEGIKVPPECKKIGEEEEDWLDLWDLADGELERRVVRAKKRAAQARKDLRRRQKEGKAERRAARDEKRRVYRDLKEVWKVVREEERRQRKAYLSIETEERKRLADEVNIFERKAAMDYCAQLGFTLQNVEGVDDIKPRALGMKGVEVDFDQIEVGEAPSALAFKGKKPEAPTNSRRVNLGAISNESRTMHVMGEDKAQDGEEQLMQDFIEFGDHEGQDFAAPNFNHRLRRKLRRAIIAAEIKKELLVREKAVEHLTSLGMPVPPVLTTSGKVVAERQHRTLENGLLETDKQERVRQRLELKEFNDAARVLRKQAKERATFAGLRIFAELMGMIPKREEPRIDFNTAPEPTAEAKMEDDDAGMSDASATDQSDRGGNGSESGTEESDSESE